MNSVPGIDLTKSWWDQKANDSLSVNDVLFFTTGEITVSDNNAAFVIMFNKELLAAYELEDPYRLVYDGNWTLDKFAQLCKTVTEDLNQDGVMDENDRFGLLVWDDSVVGIVNAAGQQCCTIAEDGMIELTLYNETTVAALEKYFFDCLLIRSMRLRIRERAHPSRHCGRGIMVCFGRPGWESFRSSAKWRAISAFCPIQN